MFQPDNHLPRRHMWMAEYLIRRENRSAWNASFLEVPYPLLDKPFLEMLVQEILHHRPVRDAVPVRSEPGVRSKSILLRPQDLYHSLPVNGQDSGVYYVQPSSG